MAKLTLVNPARRRKSRKVRASGTKRRRSSRRSNPLAVRTVKRISRRRANPHKARRVTRHRRRRNPISMRSLSSSGVMKMLTNAAIGGAGAVGMDMVMAQVNKYLPASLQPSGGAASLNDLVRFALTVAIGHFGRKVTKGMSQTAASGALAVQAADIGRALVAQHMPAATAGIGYAVPARTIPGTARIGPNRVGMNAYSRGASPLLSAVSPGRSPLLSGVGNARLRDAVRR